MGKLEERAGLGPESGGGWRKASDDRSDDGRRKLSNGTKRWKLKVNEVPAPHARMQADKSSAPKSADWSDQAGFQPMNAAGGFTSAPLVC